MPEQDLTIRHKSEGAEKVVGDLGKIDKAQEKVTEQTATGTKVGEEATKQQIELNSAEGDYIALLNLVNPQLSRAADNVLKFAKVAGEGDRASRSLAAGLANLEAAAKANMGLRKLVGAAAAARGAPK